MVVLVLGLAVLGGWDVLALLLELKRLALQTVIQNPLEPQREKSSHLLFSGTYLLHGFEVQVAELVDVLGLVAEDLPSEVVEDVGETLRHWVLLDVFACHIIF